MASGKTQATQSQPVDRLKGELRSLAGALGERAVGSLRDRVEDSVGRLKEYADNGGGSGLTAALTGVSKVAEGKSPARAMFSAGASAAKETVGGLFKRKGGKGGQKSSVKATNIVESVDIGVPVNIVYNQWTQYEDFPSFMKKVEKVERQESDEDGESSQKLNWRAQVFLSHREWEATIEDQIPDKRIIWTSKGSKGHVDGCVTFHALADDLTRVLLVMEYYPQGFFEHTGNLWRAPGRRSRLELKHFRRHVMKNVVQHPDELEGWRGVIRDGQVVKDHETALKEEQAEQRERGEADEGQGEPEDAYEGEQAEAAPEDEDQYEAEDEYEGDGEEEEDEGEPEDEYEDEYEGEPEDEYEAVDDEAEAEAEPARSSASRRERAGARR